MNIEHLIFVLLLHGFFHGAYTTTKFSFQHQLLNTLFDQYNKAVRPVLNDSLPVEVGVDVKLRKILKVDSKAQELTVSLWVTQVWKNPFLKWDSKKVGGLSSVVVEAADIWVPDLSLLNNAEINLAVAGGREKFKTPVILSSDGKCLWRAPAIFTSDCDIDVSYWPFDDQICHVIFSSITYGHRKLSLNLLDQSTTKRKSDTFVQSGGWKTLDIDLKKSTYKSSCCIELFDKIEGVFHLRRKPQYFILNFIIPSLVLCALTLISFAIPSESGERIGFITTLLLAMTVYLLIISEVLPETSNHRPITGLLFVLTIIESAVILVFTIIILRCYHGEGEPYLFLQRIYCCCCPWSKKKPRDSQIVPIEINGIVEEEEPPRVVEAIKSKCDIKDYDSPTWQDISMFLNKLFFIVSVIMISVTFLVVCLSPIFSSGSEA